MNTPKYLASLIVVGLLAGCSGESDIDRFIKDPGVKGTKPTPLPEVRQFPIADYNREEVRDPFMAKLAIKNFGYGQPGSPDFTRARQELENFPLEQLRVTGFMRQKNNLYALIIDSDKHVHRVVVGNYMGQDFGKITSITRSGVVVVESIQDNTGGWTERTVTLPYGEQNAENTAASGSKTAEAQ